MEPRDPDEFGGHLLVDFSGTEIVDTGKRHGNIPVVINPKQEKEHAHLDQETRLFRAMNEIREMKAKNMTPGERELFKIVCQSIFEKWEITPQYYREKLAGLGTPQNLRRNG